jgi:hypothetical protein
MGLLNKIFRNDGKNGPPSELPSGTRFQDSSSGGEEETEAQRTAVRRELVQVTLRETMRRHAIPSDWLEVRILPVVTRSNKSGMHVQLVVKQGQGSLLTYIPAFQSAFMGEIEKFEPRAWDWLLSISWQFAGISARSGGELPAAPDWKVGAAAAGIAGVPDTGPIDLPGPEAETDEDVAEDLKALFAIRDAALRDDEPAPAPEENDFEPTRPGYANSGGGPGS